jgi:hypothetical protein
MSLQGCGVQFVAAWEGTGGELHEVGARFTGPLVAPSWETDSWMETLAARAVPDVPDGDDLALQRTMPIARIPELSSVQSGISPLRRYRLQHVGAPFISPSPTNGVGAPFISPPFTSPSRPLRPAGNQEQRTRADLVLEAQKIVPGESSPAQQSWERRRHTIYTWLVLLTLFLLAVLGGIGLDSLIANR